MNPRESVGIALGAIRANKLRSFLTLLGIIIGVTSVIFVVSVVQGLNEYVSEKIVQAGSNVFYVDRYGFITSQEAWLSAQGRPSITVEDADILRGQMRYASMVVPMSQTFQTLRYRTKTLRGVEVRGRGAGYEIVDDVTVEQGRQVGELDDQRRRMAVVIGPEVADELFPGMDPIGKAIRVGPETYEVVGVTKVKGKMLGQSQDRFVTLPIRTFLKYKTNNPDVTIAIKSVDQGSLDASIQEVRNLLRGRRHLGPGRADNFGITTSDTFMEFYNNLTGGIFIVTIGVAAISLVVGGIVIMNIMLVSVTERTREIGVRKALGARRRDILTQFLVESTTLSLAGGLIGITLGVSMALLVGAISPLPTAVSLPAIAASMLMSSLIGVFFGSYPAVRASRLDPIDALRHE